MGDDEPDSTSITIEVGPPKYQATISKNARKALGVEGDRVVVQADLTLKRVISDGGER